MLSKMISRFYKRVCLFLGLFVYRLVTQIHLSAENPPQCWESTHYGRRCRPSFQHQPPNRPGKPPTGRTILSVIEWIKKQCCVVIFVVVIVVITVYVVFAHPSRGIKRGDKKKDNEIVEDGVDVAVRSVKRRMGRKRCRKIKWVFKNSLNSPSKEPKKELTNTPARTEKEEEATATRGEWRNQSEWRKNAGKFL